MKNNSIARILFFSLLLGVWTSCFPPVEEMDSNLEYSLQDREVRSILDAQDRRQSDTLQLVLKSQKAAHRYLAAMAFASIRDSLAVPSLIEALSDPVEEVRQAAVFALGQTGHPAAEAALIKAFVPVDSTGPFIRTNSMILEALGKCGGDSTLRLICNIHSYSPDDTLLVYGQMAAFYRFGLREKYCDDALEKIVLVATSDRFPNTARIMAAHGLQRLKHYDLNPYFDRLRKACNEEKDPDIRMALVSGLVRCNHAAVITAMEELYSRGLDIRIQSNILRGLQHHQGMPSLYFALKAIQNPSLQVSSHAAQFLVDKGHAEIAEELKKLTEQNNLPWQIRSLVYEAALKHIPGYLVLTRQGVMAQLRVRMQQAKSPYEKASYLRALATDLKALPELLQMDATEKHAIVRTTIAELIEKSMNRPDFTTVYKGSRNWIYAALGAYFQKQCGDADPGTLAVMASGFSKPRPLLNKYFKADSMLEEAQKKLKLPRDIETYNDLGKCIAGIRKKDFIPKRVEYNHPIPWNQLDGIRDTAYCLLKTSKGELQMELYPKMAPGSVANFINLIREGFYAGKIFHRIVPNFVAQAGCPRGDGYGALDYTIRTEISRIDYQQSGMLGMASAGQDTEGTQFFITHSPAPHLDGRYTIFGRLISGNEVLLSLAQGDAIQSIELK
ncbi:MAG TPA: peptidylprolyl isomerase [Saprospiraceae bacterium]|nr:peptidylprolyl isomerase [Saprospiraceae bacterium]